MDGRVGNGAADPEDDELDPADLPEDVRFKWIADGAASLNEIAARLREEADWLEQLAAAGFTLEAPVEDGLALIAHQSDPTKRIYRPVPGQPDTYERAPLP